MASFIITYRFSTKEKKPYTYQTRWYKFRKFIATYPDDYYPLSEKFLTTSTLICKNATSLERLVNKIKDERFFSKKDRVQFFKIFNDNKEKRPYEFDIAGRISNNGYEKDKDLTKFIRKATT